MIITMKQRYPLDRSFRKLHLIKAPLSSSLFPIANSFLGLFSLRSGDEISVSNYMGNLLVEPKGRGGKLPLLIYFHGGAFVYKAAPYHYKLLREYVLKCGIRVLIADYPLSPKHRYPAAADYALTLYRSSVRDYGEGRIALMGDSAGGEIVLSAMMRLIESGLPRPCFLMLIYPVVAPLSTLSKDKYTDTPVWNSRLNDRMWKYYLGAACYRSIFGYGSLSSFPPVYIETAEFDALHDEGVMLSSLLQSAGVETSLYEIPHAPHGYDMCLDGDITLASIGRRCRYIRERFSSDCSCTT